MPGLEFGAEIPEVRRVGKAATTITEFLDSGAATAKVTDHSNGFHLALRRYVKEHPNTPVEVVARNGGKEVWLRKKDN